MNDDPETWEDPRTAELLRLWARQVSPPPSEGAGEVKYPGPAPLFESPDDLASLHRALDEVDAERATGSGPMRPRKREFLGTLRARAVPLVAAALLLAMTYPAYLGFVRLPDAERRLDSLREVSDGWRREADAWRERADWSGPLDRCRLAPPARGSGGSPAPRLVLPAERPYAGLEVFGIDAVLPAETQDERAFAIRIVGESGTAWERRLVAGEIRGLLVGRESIEVLVPARALAPGRYTLTFGEPDAPRDEALLDLPFEVARTP